MQQYLSIPPSPEVVQLRLGQGSPLGFSLHELLALLPQIFGLDLRFQKRVQWVSFCGAAGGCGSKEWRGNGILLPGSLFVFVWHPFLGLLGAVHGIFEPFYASP